MKGSELKARLAAKPLPGSAPAPAPAIAREQPEIQIEIYNDLAPENPVAYQQYLKRMGSIHHEYDRWATVAIDSITFMDLAIRKLQQYKLNPQRAGHVEPRQWWAASTDQIEEQLMMRWASMPMNCIVTAHVDRDKGEVHGKAIRLPNAPGRLPGTLPSAFGELYHNVVTRDDEGNPAYILQTVKDTLFNAATQLDVADGTYPHYDMLWQDEREPYPIHVLCFGDSGSGKSTFASTFPKPMLVMMFDPIDKAAPYWKRGRRGDMYVNENGTRVIPVFKRSA